MILKIQRPLMTNGQGEPKALVYNQSRSFEAMVPFFWVEEQFKPDELKIYVRAFHNPHTGMLTIKQKLRPQSW